MPNPSKSRRNLSFADGAVGLGIVAAMIEPRSEPIPIVSAARAASRPREQSWEEEEEEEAAMDMSESYTCVITHVGSEAGERRVYPGGSRKDGGTARKFERNPVVFFPSPPTVGGVPWCGGGFLERCYLCGKSLLGMDIFMYRGERAFCSVECRCQQILMDERQEKCSSDVLKSYEYSISPCLTPLLLASRVVAA